MTLRSLLACIFLALAALVPHAALAESKTVVLSVPDMFSPACPVLARKALQRVAGVQDVQASLERKEAVVVFDSTKTSPDALVQTTRHAGFPNARVRD
ncbi:MAG TPA: heavy-metal-associated domain-containing protein [Burkholderiales bacterium]